MRTFNFRSWIAKDDKFFLSVETRVGKGTKVVLIPLFRISVVSRSLFAERHDFVAETLMEVVGVAVLYMLY